MTRAWLLSLLILLGCQNSVPDPGGSVIYPPTVDPLLTETLVPGSIFSVRGDGFLSAPAGVTEVFLDGRSADEPQQIQLTPLQITRDQLQFVVDDHLTTIFPDLGGVFIGRLTVRVRSADQDRAGESSIPIRLKYRPGIQPRLLQMPVDQIAPGALIPIQGDGLLSDREGQSDLVLRGTFQPDDGPAQSIIDATLPLSRRTERSKGLMYLHPGIFGLRPGRFEGTAILRTQSANDVERVSAPPLGITLTQVAPTVVRIEPASAARGQILTLRGWGLLPNDPMAETATLLQAEGVFTPEDGPAAPVRLAFLPDIWLNNREVHMTMRSVIGPDGRLVGLGASPGVFTGQIYAELFNGFDRVRSRAADITFQVEPPRQVVYLRYLPGFREGLTRFGLQTQISRIKAAILNVCHRDFNELRVDFTDEIPVGWAEYVTVELSGRDPNGYDLFGLDNTPEKDTGNLRLDELLGGRNAESAAAGQLPYGGIFIESFLTLSPSHTTPAIIADARFDDIFGPFSPAINPDAEPFQPGDDVRAEQLDVAVSALANLVGSTITHEVGHALGLAAMSGDVHNPTDTSGGLMDRGLDRPFVERAAIDGTSPARFLGANRQYLESLFGY